MVFLDIMYFNTKPNKNDEKAIKTICSAVLSSQIGIPVIVQ
jgi:hypothetical protein